MVKRVNKIKKLFQKEENLQIEKH